MRFNACPKHGASPYDAQQRLSAISDQTAQPKITLGYNAAGDITSRNSASYSFDAAHRLLAVAGVADYQYDGHGRRVKETPISTRSK